MKYEYQFDHVVGSSADDFTFVGFRCAAGAEMAIEETDSWIIRCTADMSLLTWGIAGWIMGLHRVPSGELYVAPLGRQLYIDAEPVDPAARTTIDLDWVATGLHGEGDRVHVWGLDLDHQPVLARWKGATVTRLPCPGSIDALATVGEQMIAVGAAGSIAIRDDHEWRTLPALTGRNLAAIHVESPEEIYVCGDGVVLRGGLALGFELVVEADLPLAGIVKYAGRILVAGTREGLFELVGSKLVRRKPDVLAQTFHVGNELLVAAQNLVGASRDGLTYETFEVQDLVDLLAGKPPLWPDGRKPTPKAKPKPKPKPKPKAKPASKSPSKNKPKA